jgi:aspartate kinase
VIVCKFGGTSVGSAERFLATADRVEERRGRGCLVVVSAMSRVTRELDRLAGLAAEGRSDEVRGVLDGLRERHHDAVVEAGVVGGEAAWVLAAIDDELARVEETAAASAGRLERPARDAILAAGELLSSRILVAVLRGRGIATEWTDPAT